MSAWVVQMEEELNSSKPQSTEGRWRINGLPDTKEYKGPDIHDVYEPYIVNFGISDDSERFKEDGLGFKGVSLNHFLKRSGKLYDSYIMALSGSHEVADAYGLLPMSVTGNRLEMMIYNGCFLLEFIYTIKDIKSRSHADDETVNPKVKSILEHRENMKLYLHDILLMGNQVPLILLQKLHCHSTGDDRIGFLKLVAATFIPSNSAPKIDIFLLRELESSLHVLDVYRRILAHRDFKREKPPIEKKRKQEEFVSTNIPAATELHNIGIGFAISDSTSLLDISFQRDTLKLPKIVIDGSTMYTFLNLIAFEKLHKVITRKEVNEYMYLMGCLIQSADDASLLQSRGIIVTIMPPYEVITLFRRMSKAVSLDPAHLDRSVH